MKNHKKVEVKGTGKGEKTVKAYSKGVIKNGDSDVAASKVHQKYGTTGNGWKSAPKGKKNVRSKKA
jgi:hypothetical protein